MSLPDGQGRDRGTTLLAVSWSVFSVATVFILLRIYTKFRVVEHTGNWALSWTLIAWTFGILNTIFVTLSVENGMGRDTQYLDQHEVSNALMYSWLANSMSRLSIGAGKTAVVAFILDLQRMVGSRWQRIFLYFIAVSNILLNIMIVFVMMFQCDPPSALWDDGSAGSCARAKERRNVNHVLGIIVTTWGGVSDLVLAVYPALLITGLQMKRRVKFGLCVLMGLGVFAAFCAGMTAYQLQAVVTSMNLTYEMTPFTLWCSTEAWVVIIAGSVPAIWPLVCDRFRQMKGKRRAAAQRDLEASPSKRIHSPTTSDETFVNSSQSSEIPLRTSNKEREDKLTLNDVLGLSESHRSDYSF